MKGAVVPSYTWRTVTNTVDALTGRMEYGYRLAACASCLDWTVYRAQAHVCLAMATADQSVGQAPLDPSAIDNGSMKTEDMSLLEATLERAVPPSTC